METAEILRDLFGTTVTIVGDPRTNTVMVRAPAEWLIQIAEAVGRLDTTDARTQQVFVYPIRHADPENLANIMQNMFQDGTRSTTTRARTTSTTSGSTTGSSRLAERAARGASTESTTSGSTRSATRR
jgi:type II secretory pathway component GspD/PulD (secretin)